MQDVLLTIVFLIINQNVTVVVVIVQTIDIYDE